MYFIKINARFKKKNIVILLVDLVNIFIGSLVLKFYVEKFSETNTQQIVNFKVHTSNNYKMLDIYKTF